MEQRFYNNTMYKNYTGIYLQTSADPYNVDITLRNNISYDNTASAIFDEDGVSIHSHNTWDSEVTITDADFVLVEESAALAELTSARQADGSLPVLTFLTLVEGSDLIDAGTDIGLGHNGDAPDMGAFESNYGAAQGTKFAISGGKLLYDANGKPMIFNE
jgi:hypothetical protein